MSSTDSGGRTPQSAKLPRLGDADTHASHMCQSPLGVFFLIAFSFAPVYAKEKADESLLLWGIDRFAQANAVGVAETGAEGVSHRLTDEVLSLK